MDLKLSEIKEIVVAATQSYFVEYENKTTKVETELGKAIVEFVKEHDIELLQTSVKWNHKDDISTYIINLYVTNEKYVNLIFDSAFKISPRINTKENFFIIGDDNDSKLFKLLDLVISKKSFISDMTEMMRDVVNRINQPDTESDESDESETNDTTDSQTDESDTEIKSNDNSSEDKLDLD